MIWQKLVHAKENGGPKDTRMFDQARVAHKLGRPQRKQREKKALMPDGSSKLAVGSDSANATKKKKEKIVHTHTSRA